MSDEERRKEQQKIDDQRAKEEAARQAKRDEAMKLVSSMNIEVATEMPKPLPPGSVRKNTIDLETNLFGIKMAEDKFIYQYDIEISCDTGMKIIEFSRKGESDYVVTDRKKKCMTVFFTAIKETGCYRDDIVFFYDGQSRLYTTERLVFGDPQKRNATVNLAGEYLTNDLHSFKNIAFVIKECAGKFECRMSDIRKMDRGILPEYRSAMHFVDVASSMYALSQCDSRFTIFSGGKIFPNDPDIKLIQTVKGGKVMVPGMSKSIELVEGPRGRDNASPALAIDSLKGVFHVKETLLNKASRVILDIHNPSDADIDTFSTMVKGLACMTHMKNEKIVEIDGISRENSSYRILLPFDMSSTPTVAEYFKNKYDYDLTYPHAPLAMVREEGSVKMYPMEVLEIMPMQRVTVAQTTPAESQESKERVVSPGITANAIADQCNLHDLFNPEQPFLKTAGIAIIPNPLRVSGRILKGPVLKYQTSEMEAVQVPWTPPQDHKKFAEAFVKRCGERGMQMNLPAIIELLPPAPEGKTYDYPARMKIKEASSNKLQFIFFITSDYLDIHNHLKLQESYSHVITQDLTLKTATDFLLKGQYEIMDTIVSKTNIKLGGLCYSINLKNVVGPKINPFKPERLILGIGLSHAPSSPDYVSSTGVQLESPTVVGYCANMTDQPTEFIGDFLFQDNKRDDVLLCTPELLQNVLDRFTGRVQPDGSRPTFKNDDPIPPPPKPFPKELIIYRQGVAEGFYQMCLREEIPLVKAILSRNGAPNCKVTFIVVEKDHNVRLMPVNMDMEENSTIQNIGSGVVVDSQLTHPRHREFFLNSHITLQGTARTPRYTVLYDDIDMSMNEMQSITHALSFNYQIVNSPVSLPTPLYVANRYAERGVALFMARNSDAMQSPEQRMRTSLAEMNEDLTYGRKNLGAVRIIS